MKRKDRLLNEAFDYKVAGPSKEDEKLLTERDIEMLKELLADHKHGYSFLSPRKVVAGGNKYREIKVANYVRCTVYLSKGLFKAPSVHTKVEKVRAFECPFGIVAFAKPAVDEKGKTCTKISILNDALTNYSHDDYYFMNSTLMNGNEKHFCIYNEKDMEDIIEKYIKYVESIALCFDDPLYYGRDRVVNNINYHLENAIDEITKENASENDREF